MPEKAPLAQEKPAESDLPPLTDEQREFGNELAKKYGNGSGRNARSMDGPQPMWQKIPGARSTTTVMWSLPSSNKWYAATEPWGRFMPQPEVVRS